MSKNDGKVNYRRPAKGRNQPNRPERRITVRSVRRDPMDLRKLGRAAITLALAEAEAEKAAETNELTQHGDATDPGARNAEQEAAHDD